MGFVANAVAEACVYIELVNGRFLAAGGTPDQYRAALAYTIKVLGWLSLHESGKYVKFAPAGAELFALNTSMDWSQIIDFNKGIG
jgi:hypothetical protein